MSDLSLELDTHQLERVIENLESYDLNKGSNDFYVNMGSKARHEIPAMILKLKLILNTSNKINVLTSRFNNTARVVISGSTMTTLSKLLEKTAKLE